MSERKPLIAANWKMNEPPVECCTPESPYRSTDNVDVWVFPSFINLHCCCDNGLITGAQYGHASDQGAHTGDVSMKMIADQKHHAVLCGHSERRQYHYETDAFVAEQVESALKHGLHPVICVGESAEEREAGKEKQVVQTQVEAVLSKCEDAEVTFAYEPVWAIGTGNTATPDDAEEMHAFIRSLLPHPDTSRIIYGGSMKPENAEELLKMPNIDGGLVGGASLIPEQFQEMIATAEKLV